ncbi:hypothetical protein [Methylobacterium radiotolerans]|uniref:hypothetical protein n=1 Tax=Methylobacterium radiotolerans TaxID=31998 RepID=UPI0011952005|nr:hypothetical protein [Methylobacterium radiotolerans]GEM95894.1 hypothetical protein MRA01_04340 [Methylobacterium radiotolerans]
MSDPTLIADLARAGLDPELLQRVAMELARAQVAVEAIEKRRTSDRVRQGRTRHVKSRDTADGTLPPVPSPDGPPPPPAPPPPPLNPSPTPGSDPDGSADDVGQAGGAGAADGDETRSFRRELMTRGIALICANTGRSEHSARGLIGHWLGIAHDEAVVVLGLIEEADGRELADFSTWVERRLQARREATGRRPDRGRPVQPAPTGLAARLIRQRAESLTGAYDVEPPAIDANDPDAGPSRGEGLGTAWQAGGASRPSDAVLRAAGQGGLDHRAAAALRARRAA